MKTNEISVILVQPPIWGVFEPSMALAQLSACLKKEKINTLVYDLNIKLYNERTSKYNNDWAIERSILWIDEQWVDTYFEDNKETIDKYIQQILDYNPKMICFSVNVNSWLSTIKIIEKISKINRNAKIVIGGPEFMVPFYVNKYFQKGLVDILIYGEGDSSIVQLAKIIEQGKSIQQCKGICYKEHDIKMSLPNATIKNLDELPFLDFSDTPLEEYDPPGHLQNHLSLMTSRGCVQKCHFCAPTNYWPGYRSMSGKRIYDEICYHLNNHQNICFIEFVDLLFNGNMKYLEEFCDLMIKSKPKKNLYWHSNMIIRKEMTLDIMKKLKLSGCQHITFGIESGSQRVLKLMNKNYLITDANNVLKNAYEAGIEVTCNFMFGFPGETEEDFKETLNFIEINRKYITKAYPSRTYCTIEPNSYMAHNLSEFNIDFKHGIHGQYWESKDKTNNFLVRLNRCLNFTEHANKLNVNIGEGVSNVELDRQLNTAMYYENICDYKMALFYYNKALDLDVNSGYIIEKIKIIKEKISEKIKVM